MSTRLIYLDGTTECTVDTPPTTEAFAELLQGLFAMRKRLGSTAFATAAALATVAFDARDVGVGTVEMLTGFGAQPVGP